MTTITPKQDRIGARVSHDVYQTLVRAADLTGATVNQFLVQSALKEAQAVIEREHVIRLSRADWNWMLELLDSPPEPNEKLKAAMERYRQAKRDDADSSCVSSTSNRSVRGLRAAPHCCTQSHREVRAMGTPAGSATPYTAPALKSDLSTAPVPQPRGAADRRQIAPNTSDVLQPSSQCSSSPKKVRAPSLSHYTEGRTCAAG